MDSICSLAECLSNLPSIPLPAGPLVDVNPSLTIEPQFPNFHSFTEGGDLGLQNIGEGKVKKGLNKITIETLDNPSYFDRVVEQGLLYGTKIPALMHGIYGNIKIG